MLTLHFGGAPTLGRCSADLQVLVSRDVVLELVGFKEIFQLLNVALVHPVHLLLGGMWCLLHLDGLPNCKTQRWVVAQSRNYEGAGTLLFPLQWLSEQVSTGTPSLSILFCVTKMLGKFKILIYQQYSQHICMHYLLCYPDNPMRTWYYSI